MTTYNTRNSISGVDIFNRSLRNVSRNTLNIPDNNDNKNKE